MEYRIREADIADLPHLVHHRRAMFAEMELGDAASLDRVDEASKNYFTQALQQGTYKGWLAETADHTVIGGGGIVLARWPGYPGETLAQRAWILNMYTEPEARGCGVAKSLVQTMISWCRDHGYNSVSLHASDAGRPIYESFGFLPTNEMRLKLR
jgi:GNAT superfamily N-acetyltransferase